MKRCFLIFLLLAGVAFGQSRTFVSDLNFSAFAENYTTNLPTALMVRNGVLSISNNGTNVWTSSEAHDWGSWLPSGAVNPDPSQGVVVNRPLVMQGSGTVWEAIGAYAVLSCDSGTVFTLSGDESSVTQTYPDGSTFKWVAESQADFPAVAQSIRMINSGAEDEAIAIDYAAAEDAGTLVLMRADTYTGPFSSVTKAVWTQTDVSTRTVTFKTAGTASGFFRARVESSVPAHFEFSAPSSFVGGVMVNNSPNGTVHYNAIIEIQVDGVVYRLPAQTVSE